MSQDLQQRIRDLKQKEHIIAPDLSWVKATRETLLMQVRNTMPEVKRTSTLKSVQDIFRYVIPREINLFIRRPAMAFLSLIAVMMGGSIMSVSAAEQALPGDFLYGLKIASEQARIAMTNTTEDKLKLKSEFTQRRVVELKSIVSTPDSDDDVVEMAETLKRDLSTIKDQLNDVANGSSSEKVAEAARLVDHNSLEVISALQDAKMSLPPESQEKVTEAQSVASETGVKAIEVLAQTHERSSEIVSIGDVTQAIQDHAKAVASATSSSAPILVPLLPIKSEAGTVMILATSSSLADISVTTTTSSTTQTDLTTLVASVKDASSQAFTQQKAQDQVNAAASILSSASPTVVNDTASTTSASATDTPLAPPTTTTIPQTSVSTTSPPEPPKTP